MRMSQVASVDLRGLGNGAYEVLETRPYIKKGAGENPSLLPEVL